MGFVAVVTKVSVISSRSVDMIDSSALVDQSPPYGISSCLASWFGALPAPSLITACPGRPLVKVCEAIELAAYLLAPVAYCFCLCYDRSKIDITVPGRTDGPCFVSPVPTRSFGAITATCAVFAARQCHKHEA
jgi:hypothetical protein